jgi:putative PEP-CTERM system TPR-repeat lipoprotein
MIRFSDRGEHVNPSIRGLALGISLAALLCAGCGEEKPAALVASAKNYLAKKDERAAVIQLKSALQKEPDLAEARFLLGRTLLDGGDPVSGEIELRKALALNYSESQVVPQLARSLVMQGKGQRAIQEFGSTDPGVPAATAELKTALATAYAQQADSANAQAALEQALRAVPDFAPALLMSARLRASEGKADAAIALVDRAIAKEPDNYDALQLKGDLLFAAKGDATGAIEAEREALAKRPDWVPAHSSAIEILLARGDLAATKTQIEQMKKVLPNHPQTLYYQARLAALNKDYKTARELTQQLLTRAPNNIKVLLLAGTVEQQAGSLSQAESLIGKAVQHAPEAANARRLLAQVQLRSGQPQKAQETLQPLLDKAAVDAETLNLAAEAALQLGDAKNAEAYFQRAAKADPTNARSRTALALEQVAKGNGETGFSQLQEVASSDKGTTADMELISARLRQQNYDAALKAIDGLEKKTPGQPLAAQMRGQVYMLRNDVAAARQSFARALEIDPSYFAAAAGLASLDLLEKKPDDARKRFEKLLVANPKDVRALIAIAELRAKAGAGKDELTGLLGNAIKLNPTVAAPRLLLIDLDLRTKDGKGALTAAQEAVAAIPDSPELLEALGRAQLASGDASQAISTFNKLAAQQPRSPQPLLRVADAYIATNNQAGARESLNRALEVAPKYLPAQRGLVILELAAGRPDQAMAVARSVQRDRPDLNVGYLFAGDIEASRKDWSAAATAYRAALSHGESDELAAKLHSMLMNGSKRAEADSFAAAWLKGHPQDAVFRSYLGDLAIAQKNYPSAEASYTAVIKLQPDNPVALNNLAWVTNKLKKPGALAFAEKANALRPGEPGFMDTLATILADSGQPAKALEIQKKAIALAPAVAPFHLNLAKLYLQSGDKSLAKAELEQLAKLGDKFANQSEVTELLKTL